MSGPDPGDAVPDVPASPPRRRAASYLHPHLEARRTGAFDGMGVFADAALEEGTVLAVWGGLVVDREGLDALAPRDRQLTLQIEEGLYLAPAGPPDPADFVNHSCDPNAGLRGQVVLVARRPIAAGEEVCYDYAMSEVTAYDEFECRCGSELCRGRVTAEDWKDPELWERYEGCFSPYLERRIRRLRRGVGGERAGS